MRFRRHRNQVAPPKAHLLDGLMDQLKSLNVNTVRNDPRRSEFVKHGCLQR